MKLYVGIVTDKMTETEQFYTQVLGFSVSFKNESYLLLQTPDGSNELSFLRPNEADQPEILRKPFLDQGVFITLEVKDVNAFYNDVRSKGVEIVEDLKDELWGDRHFVIQDPNSIGIDIVSYIAPRV